MAMYNEVKNARAIKRRALVISAAFYGLLIGLLILGYQDNVMDIFPDPVMKWMDGLFNNTLIEPTAPQAFSYKI